VSPENLDAFLEGKNKELTVGKKSDIWALGVILIEMCNMQRIYGHNKIGVNEKVAFSDSKSG